MDTEQPIPDSIEITAEEFQALRSQLTRQEKLIANYRRVVGKLATHRCKNTAWGIMMAWAPGDVIQSVGFDLETPEEQKAFIFGL